MNEKNKKDYSFLIFKWRSNGARYDLHYNLLIDE